MRLSPSELAAVAQAARAALPGGSRVSLFGSRTDDRRRGGDIDLLVEVPGLSGPTDVVSQRIRFTAQLYRLLGERRIDVLMADPEDRRQPLIQSARQDAITLVTT